MSKKVLASCLLLVSASISSVKAVDIFDTVNSTAPNAANNFNISGGTNSKFQASPFRVDSGYQAQINSITLKLAKGFSVSDPDATFQVGMYKSAVGSYTPTSFVTGGDFGNQVVTATTGTNTTFTASQPLTLEGGFRYYIMIGVSTTTTTAYFRSATSGGPPANQVVNLAPTTGLSWSNQTDIVSWFSAATNTLTTTIDSVNLTGGSLLGNNNPLFSLNGTVTAVPEPGTYVMASLTMMTLALVRRNRKQRNI